MPKHVLMSDYAIITDGGRRRRWSSAGCSTTATSSKSGMRVSDCAKSVGVAFCKMPLPAHSTIDTSSSEGGSS